MAGSANRLPEEGSELKGIKKHHVTMIPVYKINRKESYLETLNLFTSEGIEGNLWIFPRTTHLYQRDLDILTKIKIKVNENENLENGNIEHVASELGFTHKIVFKHKSGSIITFDGLFLKCTQTITNESFSLQELLTRTGVPSSQHECIIEFEGIIRDMFPERNLRANPHDYYYTIDQTNFEKIGIKRGGRAQVRLTLNDPNYVTITGLIYYKTGKEFHVYIGEEEQIHQMIAHDLFIRNEINGFISFFGSQLTKVLKYNSNLKTDYGGLIYPIWAINKKRKMWNKVKINIKALYEIYDYAEKGRLLTSTIKTIIDKKWAFFNGPRQIWLEGDEKDIEQKIQHHISNFYNIVINGENLKIPSEPSVPSYTEAYESLCKEIIYLSKLTNKVYERERDLLTAYQTEFSLYAVLLTIIAIILAMLALSPFKVYGWCLKVARNFIASSRGLPPP